MKQIKIADVLLALEKIVRKTGEDEDEIICDLDEQYNIKITEEELSSSLRESLSEEHIWIWVLKPFNKEKFKAEKKSLHSIKYDNQISINKLVRKEKIDGKYYIKCPKYILLSRVDDNIFECLLEDHGIKYEDLPRSEWETIICSKEFRQAQIQVARELIAHETHHELLYQNWRS
ncbi:MAG: hypothetical protein ACFFCV_18750 [Promethearchaeota archaeon]